MGDSLAYLPLFQPCATGDNNTGLVMLLSVLTITSLACHGMRKWKRGFLVPWILFYLLVLGFLTLNLLQALYLHNFHVEWRDLFLFFAVFTIFSCWRHMKKQYLLMALPRPEQVHITTTIMLSKPKLNVNLTAIQPKLGLT